MSDVYFSLSYWLYLPQTWIIIGILGILLELTDGSRIFFLPIGLAGLVVSAHVKLTFDNALDPDLLPETVLACHGMDDHCRGDFGPACQLPADDAKARKFRG